MTHTSDTRSVRARFSAAAPTYDRHVGAQARAADALMALVPRGLRPARILEIGCGTGLLTGRLLERFPDAGIDAVDLSERMVHQARARVGDTPRARWFAADAAHFQAAERYPLVVSNASLHWMTPLRDGFTHLLRLLDDGGVMVFAVMVRGTLRELYEARLAVAPRKPPLGRLPTGQQVLSDLAAAGAAVSASKTEEFRVVHPDPAAFLQSLHEQGLTGGQVSRAVLPLHRGEIERLKAHYAAQYRDATGEVFASYRVLLVLASRGA